MANVVYQITTGVTDLVLTMPGPPCPPMLRPSLQRLLDNAEAAIVREFNLTNLADKPLRHGDCAFGGNLESARRLDRAIAQLTNILNRKVTFHGDQHPATARTQIHLARACCLRGKEGWALDEAFDNHKKLIDQALTLFSEVIDRILEGHVDARILDIYPKQTTLERKFGIIRELLPTNLPAPIRKALVALPVALEHIATAESSRKPEEAAQMRQRIVDALGVSLVCTVCPDEAKATTPAFVPILSAALELESLDYRIRSLVEVVGLLNDQPEMPYGGPEEQSDQAVSNQSFTREIEEAVNRLSAVQQTLVRYKGADTELHYKGTETELLRIGILQGILDLAKGKTTCARTKDPVTVKDKIRALLGPRSANSASCTGEIFGVEDKMWLASYAHLLLVDFLFREFRILFTSQDGFYNTAEFYCVLQTVEALFEAAGPDSYGGLATVREKMGDWHMNETNEVIMDIANLDFEELMGPFRNALICYSAARDTYLQARGGSAAENQPFYVKQAYIEQAIESLNTKIRDLDSLIKNYEKLHNPDSNDFLWRWSIALSSLARALQIRPL